MEERQLNLLQNICKTNIQSQVGLAWLPFLCTDSCDYDHIHICWSQFMKLADGLESEKSKVLPCNGILGVEAEVPILRVKHG